MAIELPLKGYHTNYLIIMKASGYLYGFCSFLIAFIDQTYIKKKRLSHDNQSSLLTLNLIL